MKLIDAEAVKAEINRIGNIADFIKEAICAKIDEQPEAVKAEINRIGNIADFIKEAICAEIDEQPEAVIRCKDCKNNPNSKWADWIRCPMTGKNTRKQDDFCSYGER